MSDVVIKVKNLFKEYRLGTISHGTLQQDLQSWWARMRGKEDPNAQIQTHNISVNTNNNERFWALKDVSFEVKNGEALGIIGRNGTGKSTLLKILSRITSPTSGSVKIRGRVSSLLEVGTGFHPELTGRENIFLNGAIFGMNKTEIKRKLDEIIAFAGIDRFINTPVKRYSSGMYVRLAFAVAAHLEPEILIVDEVLAVGDAQFQKKCLGKMEEVGREGRTVLFVSHNMGAIQQLTNRCVVLQDGSISFYGDVSQGVEHYLSVNESDERHVCKNLKTSDDKFFITSFYYEEKADGKGFNAPLSLKLDLDLKKPFSEVLFRFGIVNSLGCRIMTVQETVQEIPVGDVNAEFVVTDHKLPPGNYSASLIISLRGTVIMTKENAISFSVSEVGVADPFLIQRRDRIGVFLRPYCRITANTEMPGKIGDAL